MPPARTPRPPEAGVDSPPDDDLVEVAGELDGQHVPLEGQVRPDPVALQVQPSFTAAQISEDGHNRVSRTGSQAGVALLVTIVVRYFIIRYVGKQHLPPDEVLDALQALVTIGWARWANRERIRGTL